MDLYSTENRIHPENANQRDKNFFLERKEKKSYFLFQALMNGIKNRNYNYSTFLQLDMAEKSHFEECIIMQRF